MRAKLSRKSVFFKVVNFVVLSSFVFTGFPAKSYAAGSSSYNLRKIAAMGSDSAAQIKRIFESDEKIKKSISGLDKYLTRIGVSDTDSIPKKIRSQFSLDTAAEDLSFMVCNDGFWVTGSEQEEGTQVFMRINAAGKNGFSARFKEIVKEAKGELIEEGNIVKISLPASAPQARREILLEISAGLVTERNVIADGLTYDQPAYVMTPLTERMIFGAKLEKKFLTDFESGAEAAKKKNPELVKFIEHLKDPNSGPYELNIPVEEWNLAQISANIKKLARFALAGMRDTKNPLFAGDLNQPINIIQLLLVGNELAEMALEQAKLENRESIDCIVAGEVRYDTFLLNEQLRRRYAEMGITVHSVPKGTYLPIGATSFITTFLDMMFTIYTTSSHSGRSILSDKLMGFQKVPVSPFVKKYLKEMGIDEKEYNRSRSEGAQLLVEQMLVLADRIDNRIKKAGKVLTIKFAAGNDKNIHFDIQNPASPNNIDVIKEYAGYLRRGFVSESNIKSVQEALNNGMKMGASATRGAAFKFFSEVYKEVFGNNVARNIQWLETVPDSFFGDTGMSDFKKDIEDPFLKQYVQASKDNLAAYFSNLPYRATLLATISEKDLAEKIKAAPREGKTMMNIRFTVQAKEEEDLLKKIGMPYLEISNNRLLVYYEPKLRDASQDVSLLEVVSASKLPAVMLSKPIGYRLPITDPDGDRYVEMQVEKNTKENRDLLKKLNVGYLVLSEEKLLVVYVPNQTFLQIESAYIQQLKDMNKFHQDIADTDAATFFAIKTTVSSSTWLELCTAEGVPVIQVPVGFREIGAIMRKIEFQLMVNNVRKHLGLKPRMVVVHDIFNNPIKLGYNPRQLSGKEESGGLVLGTSELLVTKDGMRSYLSWREKNAIDPSISMLIGTSERFNRAREEALKRGVKPEELYDDEKFQQEISLLKWLNEIYTKYEMKNTAELRSDVELVDSLEVAKVKQKDPKKADKMKEDAVLRRDTNFTFFLSLAFALQEGHVDLNEVKAILKENLLADAKMIERIKSVTNDSAPEILARQIDDLQGFKFAGDQVYMEFSNGAWQIVRPSGTDPKIKSYPSTADPVVSAVISNAIGEVYPEKFFELGAGKIVENMPATTAYAKKMREKNPVLLEVKATKDFQQTQYERGAKVDTMPDWAADEGVQKLLEQKFPEVTKDGRTVSSVQIFLGPVSQKQALLYDPESHIIYTSWDFDDRMSASEHKTEAFLAALTLFQKDFEIYSTSSHSSGKNTAVINSEVTAIAGKLGIDAGLLDGVYKANERIHQETGGNAFDSFAGTMQTLLKSDEKLKWTVSAQASTDSFRPNGIDIVLKVADNLGNIVVEKTISETESENAVNKSLFIGIFNQSIPSIFSNIDFSNPEKVGQVKNILKQEKDSDRINTLVYLEALVVLDRLGVLSAKAPKVLMIDSQFFLKTGALGGVQRLIELLSNQFKIGLYGGGAEKLKIFLGGNENIVTAGTSDELIKNLRAGNNKIEFIYLSPAIETSLAEGTQLVFSKEGLAVVDLAKALERMFPLGESAFKKLVAAFNENKVIAQKSYYAPAHEFESPDKTIKAQEYLDLPAIMPTEAVAGKIEDDAKKASEFVVDTFI